MSGSAVDSAGGSAVTRKGREKKVEQKENVVEAAANVGNAPTNELTIAGCSSEFVTSLLCYCWTGQYFWVDSICTIEESTNLESAGICRVFRGYSMYRRGMLDEALVLLDPFCLEEDAKAGDGFALPIASVICLVHAAKDSDKSTAASSKATLKTLFKASADVPTFVSACLYLADEDIPKSKALIEKLLAADQTNVAFLGLFGWLNLLLANGPKALQCFTKALKINAKDPLALYGLAVQRDRYEDAHKALQAATKLLQIYRESSVALEERTRLLLLTGQLSQAFATAKKASKICGESWVGYRCLFLQALITETPEDPARAFKVLKKLLKIVEQNGSENSPHVRTQSLKVMELALSLSPMYSINTANILKLGDAVLRRCLKVDADDIPALVVYGRLLLKTGLDTKLLQAIKMFTRARSLLPGELEKEAAIVTEAKAHSYASSERIKALTLASRQAAHGLVWLWADQSKFAEAKRFLQGVSDDERSSSLLLAANAYLVYKAEPLPHNSVAIDALIQAAQVHNLLLQSTARDDRFYSLVDVGVIEQMVILGRALLGWSLENAASYAPQNSLRASALLGQLVGLMRTLLTAPAAAGEEQALAEPALFLLQPHLWLAELHLLDHNFDSCEAVLNTARSLNGEAANDMLQALSDRCVSWRERAAAKKESHGTTNKQADAGKESESDAELDFGEENPLPVGFSDVTPTKELRSESLLAQEGVMSPLALDLDEDLDGRKEEKKEAKTQAPTNAAPEAKAVEIKLPLHKVKELSSLELSSAEKLAEEQLAAERRLREKEQQRKRAEEEEMRFKAMAEARQKIMDAERKERAALEAKLRAQAEAALALDNGRETDSPPKPAPQAALPAVSTETKLTQDEILRAQTKIAQEFASYAKKGEKFKKHGRQGDPHTKTITVTLRKDLTTVEARWFGFLYNSRSLGPGDKFMTLTKGDAVLLDGKKTLVFQRSASAKAPESLCFSLANAQRSLDLEAFDQESKDKWWRALKLLVMSLHSS